VQACADEVSGRGRSARARTKGADEVPWRGQRARTKCQGARRGSEGGTHAKVLVREEEKVGVSSGY